MGWGTASTAPSPGNGDTWSKQEEGDGQSPWGWLVVMPQPVLEGRMEL